MRNPLMIDNKPWWESVDWTKGNKSIAKELGLAPSVVVRRRKKLNIPNSTITGTPKGVKRSKEFKDRVSRFMKGKTWKRIDDWDYQWSSKSKKGKPSKSYKKAVKRAFGVACEICGYHKPPIENHCHHIVEKHRGGTDTIRNSMIVCSRCHDEIHAGILEIPQHIKERSSENRE